MPPLQAADDLIEFVHFRMYDRKIADQAALFYIQPTIFRRLTSLTGFQGRRAQPHSFKQELRKLRVEVTISFRQGDEAIQLSM
jgi:hypothetical protein